MHVVVACLRAAAVAALFVVGTVRARDAAFQRNPTKAQFLDHVLMHQREWKLIMRERLRDLHAPPHGVQLPAGQPGDEADVWPIVASVVAGHSVVGSAVKYAAQAINRAMACFTYRHVTFQAHYVQGLLVKEVLPDTVHAELAAFKDVIVLALDKLTVVPSDLALLFETYWEVVRLMQFDVVHRVRRKEYPPRAGDPIGRIHDRLVEYMAAKCTAFRLNRQLFADLGVRVPNGIILDDVLRLAAKEDALIDLGRSHAKSLARYYRNLKIEVMPRRQWTQIFYYAKRIDEDEELDETNPRIAPVGQSGAAAQVGSPDSPA